MNVQKFARVQLVDGSTHFAQVEQDRLLLLDVAPWQGGGVVDALEADGTQTEYRLLAPVVPGKVIAVGLNYRSHVAEMHDTLPEEPIIFLKPPSAVIGPGTPIRLPEMSREVHYEAELAIVIGKTASRVQESEAAEFIWGYTCANDVTARDLQRKDGQWTRSKSFDTFCPLGPYVVKGMDATALSVQTFVAGKLSQDGNTKDMIFSVPYLVHFISQVMTLQPGDVILTGTPEGVGSIHVGDQVEVRIEGIGVLANPVA